ncbi:hypothetical protein [Leuconostoc falkenbergense]|nr:hypothetical protein [Leuconostoc falkenbergense]MDV3544736.1 hypothetical protein [Leuconostoc falkenbergense]
MPKKSVKESIKQRDILKDKLSYYQKAIEVGETNVTWSAKHKLK